MRRGPSSASSAPGSPRPRLRSGREIEVVAALVEVEGRLLLARRGKSEKHAGLWELPGGKVEPGESPEAALRREIREELGVAFSARAREVTYCLDFASLSYRFMVIHGSLSSFTFTLTAHDEVRAFERADLPWSNLAPLDAEPLRDWMAGRFSPPDQRLS